MNSDTISAVATANGIGSIAIIRISGDRALGIAKKLTDNKDLNPRYATLTNIYDFKNELIDESIVIYFKAPFSFTAEDVVEIQCHGGFIVAQSVLKATIAHGARLATAGEFSKRAFFNGRIDLSQAEAIAQLIEAKSEDASRILAQQMKGSLKEYVENIRDEIIHILAYSEVSIDYAEEDLPEDLVLQIEAKLEDLRKSLQKTLQASRAREGLMQGFRVAIVGKPNVGKSSLLNYLLKESRAIVSDIPGTTRDVIREEIMIDGILFKLFDTAGIRLSENLIEVEGVRRSNEAIVNSDFVLFVNDVEQGYSKDLFNELQQLTGGERIIPVINKIDLGIKTDVGDAVKISATTGQGIENLITRMKQCAIGNANYSEKSAIVSNIRHIHCLHSAKDSLSEAIVSLNQKYSGEFIAVDLRSAVDFLGEIIGEVTSEDVLNNIFSKFCIGK